MDFAKEALFERIDEQWEDFGLPKVELDNIDNNSADFPTKGSKKVRNRATRRKATAKKKARNKRLANAKGFNLNLCSRPDKNGSRNVLSNRFCKGYKKWFPDPVKMEQNKVSARELKKYFDSLVKDETREKDFLEEYNEEIYDCTMKELVDEYLSLRSEGYRIKKDPYRYFQQNDLLDFMTVTTREGEDRTARFFRYFNNGDGEWIDYNTEYMCLSNLIFRMKQRKQTLAPIFNVAKTMSEELHVEIRVTTEMIPDNFHITQLNELAGLFLQYCPNSNEYTYCAMTRKQELIYLFAVERDFYTARELDFISRELETEFQIMLNI